MLFLVNLLVLMNNHQQPLISSTFSPKLKTICITLKPNFVYNFCSCKIQTLQDDFVTLCKSAMAITHPKSAFYREASALLKRGMQLLITLGFVSTDPGSPTFKKRKQKSSYLNISCLTKLQRLLLPQKKQK